MTGTFSIKRRKQDTPRPQGQSSQLSVLAALGIGVGRSSPHVGSKRGYQHLSDPTPDLAYARAQEWHIATGRPLPPSMKPLRPVTPPAPLDVHQRAGTYLGMRLRGPAGHVTAKKLSTFTTDGLLDHADLTPAQRRRLLHKAGSHGERPAGFKPAAATTPGSRAPRSPAAKRRAAKNDAQRRRHLDRYWREHPLTSVELARLATGQPILEIRDEIAAWEPDAWRREVNR